MRFGFCQVWSTKTIRTFLIVENLCGFDVRKRQSGMSAFHHVRLMSVLPGANRGGVVWVVMSRIMSVRPEEPERSLPCQDPRS